MAKWDNQDKYTSQKNTVEPELTATQEKLVQVYEKVVSKMEASGDIVDTWKEQDLLGKISILLTNVNSAIELTASNKFPAYDQNTLASIRDSLLTAEENLISAANNIESWLTNEEAAVALEKKWQLPEGTLFFPDNNDDIEQ